MKDREEWDSINIAVVPNLLEEFDEVSALFSMPIDDGYLIGPWNGLYL